jgi:SAM-dependent methyltransferase
MSDRWYAWLMQRVSGTYDRLLADRKRALLGGLRGTIVELGPGTGVNLKYLPAGTRWIGIEPNPILRAALCDAGLDARDGRAESLDIESGSVDAVVSTAVLCSVRDLDRALAEARRVLKPGGRFVFVEHVVAGGAVPRFGQRLIRPLWRCCAGGCDPARDTAAAIRHAFGPVEIVRFRLPLGPVAPHIAGAARR